MVRAIILVKSPKKLIAARLRKIDCVSESFPVSGQFDAVVIIAINDLAQNVLTIYHVRNLARKRSVKIIT